MRRLLAILVLLLIGLPVSAGMVWLPQVSDVEAGMVIKQNESGGNYIVSYGGSETAFHNSSSPGSYPIDVPSGASDGDKLILCVSDDTDSAFTLTGWTVVKEVAASTSRLTCLERVASSEPASYSLSAQSNSAAAMAYFTKSGGTWKPFGASNSSSATTGSSNETSLTTTSVTGEDNAILIVSFENDNAIDVLTHPADMTTIYSVKLGSAAFSMYYEVSSSGPVTKTITYASDDNIAGIALVLGAE